MRVCVRVLPAVAGPDPSGSPAVGVCYEAARGGGGDLDVKEERLSSEEELLTEKRYSLLKTHRAHVTSERQVPFVATLYLRHL